MRRKKDRVGRTRGKIQNWSYQFPGKKYGIARPPGTQNVWTSKFILSNGIHRSSGNWIAQGPRNKGHGDLPGNEITESIPSSIGMFQIRSCSLELQQLKNLCCHSHRQFFLTWTQEFVAACSAIWVSPCRDLTVSGRKKGGKKTCCILWLERAHSKTELKALVRSTTWSSKIEFRISQIHQVSCQPTGGFLWNRNVTSTGWACLSVD